MAGFGADAARSAAERKADLLAAIEREPSSWLASASDQGAPHLIALSHLWDDDRLVFSTPARSLTARNLRRSGAVRVALPSTVEVVTIDGVAELIPLDADPALVQRFVDRCQWDPRIEGAGDADVYLLIIVTPRRIQAFTGVEELAGRDVLRDGVWLA